MLDRHAKIVFAGIDFPLSAELTSALEPTGSEIETAALEPESLAHCAADVIFCQFEPARVRRLASAIESLRRRVPIVVVGRLPEVSDWLDSIEAGATDYCTAPFETAQIEWVLETCLKPATARTALV